MGEQVSEKGYERQCEKHTECGCKKGATCCLICPLKQCVMR
jgi:hypothetical protein